MVMEQQSKGRSLFRPLTHRRVGLGVVLYLSISSLLYAAPGGNPPGWCKSQAAVATSANLSFGNFYSSDVGLVIVDTAGNRNASGGVALLGGTVSQAVFSLTGCANYGYSIVLPPDTPITAGTNTMTATTFQSNPVGSGVLDANGLGTLSLGAALQVGFQQPGGNYTGTFTLELVFQ